MNAHLLNLLNNELENILDELAYYARPGAAPADSDDIIVLANRIHGLQEILRDQTDKGPKLWAIRLMPFDK